MPERRRDVIPFANDTVTLVHRNASGWKSEVIHGCSFRRIRRRSVTGQTAVIENESVCRIPPGGIVPAAGDLILPGVHTASADSEIELVRLLEAHRADGAFRISSVSDNTRGAPIPHYAARGE